MPRGRPKGSKNKPKTEENGKNTMKVKKEAFKKVKVEAAVKATVEVEVEIDEVHSRLFYACITRNPNTKAKAVKRHYSCPAARRPQ